MTAMSIKVTFKRKFIAGLFILIPAIITVFAISWFFRLVDGILEPVFYRILGYHTPGLGFVSAIVLVFIVGIVSTNVFGKKIILFFERIFLNIPVFRSFYTAVKQLVDAFSPESKSSSFKRVVIIEYPKKDTYVFGFLTKENTVLADHSGRELNLRAVYVPTNNLYLGEIVLVPEGSVFATDIPVDEGMKIILSGGIAAPQRIGESRS